MGESDRWWIPVAVMRCTPANVCFLAASSLVPFAVAGQGGETAQQDFANVFLMVRKAEEQERAGDLRGALTIFRSAAGVLVKIKKEAPGWQADVVEFRLKRTMEAMDRIQTKLGGPAGGNGANEARPGVR
jgi:hypothetical protein